MGIREIGYNLFGQLDAPMVVFMCESFSESQRGLNWGGCQKHYDLCSGFVIYIVPVYLVARFQRGDYIQFPHKIRQLNEFAARRIFKPFQKQGL